MHSRGFQGVKEFCGVCNNSMLVWNSVNWFVNNFITWKVIQQLLVIMCDSHFLGQESLFHKATSNCDSLYRWRLLKTAVFSSSMVDTMLPLPGVYWRTNGNFPAPVLSRTLANVPANVLPYNWMLIFVVRCSTSACAHSFDALKQTSTSFARVPPQTTGNVWWKPPSIANTIAMPPYIEHGASSYVLKRAFHCLQCKCACLTL